MTNIIPVPVLGAQGWVTDPSNKIDNLLSHIFLTDSNQSYLYSGNVFSIQSIWQETGGDLSYTIGKLKSIINSHLNKYYQDVEVNVSFKEENPNLVDGSGYSIILNIGVYDGVVNSEHTRLLNMSGGKLEQILKINNQGG